MEDLVRGAAENEPGEIAASPRPHDDDADVVLDRVSDDLAGGVPENRVPYLAAGRDPGCGKFLNRSIDRRLRLIRRLPRHQPGLGNDLALAQVQHPHFAM